MGEVVAHPASPPKRLRSEIDWEAIGREYRAGQLTVIEIARQHDISHTAINKRAKKEGWERDLSAQVRREIKSRLVSEVSDPVSEKVSEERSRETVEIAAQRGVEIVRGHRRDIAAAREVCSDLLEELRVSTAFRDQIAEEIDAFTEADEGASEKAKANAEKRRAAMHRAVSLSSRASTIMSLASAAKHLVYLERQAFNLDDTAEPATPGLIEITEQNARDYARKVAFILSQRQAQPILEATALAKQGN